MKMKSIKFYKYANKYIDLLNSFYDKYTNNINENVLNNEYDLMIDILDELIYNHKDVWCINFNKNKYCNNIIFKADKKCWKMLSKIYKKMWMIAFEF